MKKIITIGMLSLVVLLGMGICKAEAGPRHRHWRHHGYHWGHGYWHRPYWKPYRPCYRPYRPYYGPWYHPGVVYRRPASEVVVVF